MKLSVAAGALALGLITVVAPAGAKVRHLDPAVRNPIMTGDYRVVLHVKEIPVPVLTAAEAARGYNAKYPLPIADPGQPYQATDVIDKPGLPGRRLVAAFASGDYWILSYEAGGIAHSDHIAVFELSGAHARFLWHTTVYDKVTSINDLRELIRSSDTANIDDSYTQFY